jgi:hypothetical protein
VSLDNCGFRPTVIESFFFLGQILGKFLFFSVNSTNVLAKKPSNFLRQNIEKDAKGSMAQQ